MLRTLKRIYQPSDATTAERFDGIGDPGQCRAPFTGGSGSNHEARPETRNLLRFRARPSSADPPICVTWVDVTS
jgi:hypothetical protein